MENKNTENIEAIPFSQRLLYKMDRTIAIIGITLMGIMALSNNLEQLAIAAVGILGGYVGGRASK